MASVVGLPIHQFLRRIDEKSSCPCPASCLLPLTLLLPAPSPLKLALHNASSPSKIQVIARCASSRLHSCRPRLLQPEGQGCAAHLMEERSGRRDPCCTNELGKGRDSESMGKEVGEGLRLVGAMARGWGHATVTRSRRRPGEFVREIELLHRRRTGF
jgi:hypothetical protein